MSQSSSPLYPPGMAKTKLVVVGNKSHKHFTATKLFYTTYTYTYTLKGRSRTLASFRNHIWRAWQGSGPGKVSLVLVTGGSSAIVPHGVPTGS